VQVRVERAGAGVDVVVEAFAESAAAAEGVLADPAVGVLVTAVSATRITGRVQFWHDPARGLSVTSGVVAALTAALARRGWSATVTSEAVVPPLVPGDPV